MTLVKFCHPQILNTITNNKYSHLDLCFRLTFWLSNTIVLREIISQAFGNSCQVSPIMRLAESNGAGKRNDGKPASLKWKGNSNGKSGNGFMQFIEDWQETGTFTSALERVESWIFSRIVESVWWQVYNCCLLFKLDK